MVLCCSRIPYLPAKSSTFKGCHLVFVTEILDLTSIGSTRHVWISNGGQEISASFRIHSPRNRSRRNRLMIGKPMIADSGQRNEWYASKVVRRSSE
ncbi:Uncharacterised protein g6177 [Pycnogonum litorale]